MTREAILKEQKDKRTRCTVWTRVMGYARPICGFNKGKIGEHNERTMFLEKK